MNKRISPIIQGKALLEMFPAEDLVIVHVGNGEKARENHDKRHLQGALFVDLDAQLAAIKQDVSAGGRHPLPPIEKFSKTLRALGISQKSHIIAYDEHHGANAAARFWWMLRAIGHELVQVLDGGLHAAQQIGFPLSQEKEQASESGIYVLDGWRLPLAEIDDVERAVYDSRFLVIDVRDADRYRGWTEPIDLIAGHIPGAVNAPFIGNLDLEGRFRSPKVLKEKYERILGGRRSDAVIVHCGSGVTACHTLLAMDYAGLQIPSLYVGSWSEWSRNNKDIATNQQ